MPESSVSFQKVRLGNGSRKTALKLLLENMMAHENAMYFLLQCFCYLLQKDNYRKVFCSRVIFFFNLAGLALPELFCNVAVLTSPKFFVTFGMGK